MGVRDVITGRLLTSASVQFSDQQVADTLELLIAHGMRRGASSIHIEPQGAVVLVRYRIDGTLRGMHKLPATTLILLTRKLKRLAELDPNNTVSPHEGQFGSEFEEKPVHVRLSVMPVLGGEKAVLHLAPEQVAPRALENLGFWGADLEALRELVSRPQGLITVTGPKHAGKTTTLYSLLQLAQTPGHSLATLEEHPTIRLNRVAQAYVHRQAGTSMASGLRAVLRQDPDIVMIGAVPDRETADLAVQAATSGHLLLAEIHAEDAVTGALRLRSMSSAPFVMATALRAAVGQRLVRKLCPHCRQRFELTAELRHKLETAFGITTPAAHKRVFELELAAQRAGLGKDSDLSSAKDSITHVWRARGGGCERCERSGYQGRTAITELLQNSEAVQGSLLKSELPTPNTLRRAALRAGFTPMGLDGLVKVLRGITTVAEVLRAITPGKP